MVMLVRMMLICVCLWVCRSASASGWTELLDSSTEAPARSLSPDATERHELRQGLCVCYVCARVRARQGLLRNFFCRNLHAQGSLSRVHNVAPRCIARTRTRARAQTQTQTQTQTWEHDSFRRSLSPKKQSHFPPGFLQTS